jgi:hypothetical protein
MVVLKELYANDPTTTLSSSATSGATTIDVTSATPFPTAGNFTIRIDDEFLLVTAIASLVFTVSRGQEGSTAASHASGAAVTLVITDGSLRRLAVQSHGGTIISARRQINLIDGGGVTWTLTDDPTNDKVDISAVASGGGGGGYEMALTVPALADYTWLNQGTATAHDTDGLGIFLRAPNASQDNYRALLIAAGTPPWSYVAKIVPMVFQVSNAACGVVVCGGTGDPRAHILRLCNAKVDGVQLNSMTSFASSDLTGVLIDPSSRISWFKIARSGSVITYSVSFDGNNWVDVFTTDTSNGALDHVGFFVESAPATSLDCCVKCVSSKLN